jgi:hypothetical protein
VSPSGLQLEQTPELLLDLVEHRTWNRPELLTQPTIVDRSYLIDHHLAVGAVPGSACGQEDTQQTFSSEPGGARQDYGRRMPYLVQ